MMPVTLRDLRAAKRALLPRCRIHPEHTSATCPDCYDHAATQRDKQWRRQREAAHAEYLRQRAAA